MADKKQKSGDGTPSADEIIEALALEMGVDNQKEAKDDDGGKADEAEAKEEAEASKEDDEPKEEEAKASKKGDDPIAGLGGIFEVGDGGGSKKSKKKKGGKKAKAAESKKEEAPAKSSGGGGGVEAIDSIFNVTGGGSDDDIDLSDVGLDDDDDDFERKVGGGGNRALIAMVVVMGLGMLVMGVMMFGGENVGSDIMAVLNGTYRDKKDAEKRRLEEEHRKEQLEMMEKYGALRIGGEPRYGLIHVQLEGDAAPRPLLAQYGADSPWTELRTSTVIQNLKIKKPINVRIESPGYQPQTVTLTQDVWQETGLGEYQHELNLYLQPANPFSAAEMADRMLPFEEEDEQFGTIFVESKPAGAKIKLNNKLVVDKDGNPILTKADGPIALTELMQEPDKDGKKKKTEAKKLKINTPPDNGYKVELFFDDASKPRYVAVAQRALWTCTPKSDDELKRVKKDARPALKCNYTYKVVGDFNAIQAEIQRQKKVEEELRKQKEELEALRKKQEEEVKNGGKPVEE